MLDDASFDVPGHLRRARRLADLSQRELAHLLAVGSSTVARWEAADGEITVRMLDHALRLAGLRLGVLDETGRPVSPVSPDAVRDNGGRCFPAHLDVVPPDERPRNRGLGPRYDRRPALGWYALRATRDAATAPGRHRPAEHPTVAELAMRRHSRLSQATAGAAVLSPAVEVPVGLECECLDDCPEHHACPPECPCQCEPPGWADRRARLE
ncbi:HTH-type transcriptional regulator / antitoxin HipB [Pedococcus dokdonensis]|uniref:HTH-type transcriptional regulator / antitoxin HipB n=1 Tax=Pedococcus dokdonensis TaxID=443156 RepID=A0A1H0TU80_9MICO|nr:helix-turn-helix transcriptional regulator [Pedococcus dokdonensis]SDP57539.1 HTH-type transcriptional regulator / antitoxin HipB [Pedococcus dokdonensis]